MQGRAPIVVPQVRVHLVAQQDPKVLHIPPRRVVAHGGRRIVQQQLALGSQQLLHDVRLLCVDRLHQRSLTPPALDVLFRSALQQHLHSTSAPPRVYPR
eukprot:768178-Hanusia_phi.AAC.4